MSMKVSVSARERENELKQEQKHGQGEGTVPDMSIAAPYPHAALRLQGSPKQGITSPVPSRTPTALPCPTHTVTSAHV